MSLLSDGFHAGFAGRPAHGFSGVLATTLATNGGAVLTVGSLFSGCGLLDYGLTLAGLEHRWFAEADPFRRTILAKRWPGIGVFDDVRAVGASAERVDVIAGGFPCKGASSAGKRNGFDHPETVLWREMARAIGDLRPRFVVVENVADLLSVRDGAVWGEVLGTLASLGFDVVWDCIPAGAFGAPHLRDRVVAIATHADDGVFGDGCGGVACTSASGQRCESGEDRGFADLDRGNASATAGAEGERWAKAEPAIQQPGLESLSRRGADAAADATSRSARCHAAEGAPGLAAKPHGERGAPVEWEAYAPAIARWEAVHGPAPEPLVRRVDDRSAMRVERSRLSALGDGVQVQLGELVGRYLMAEVRARAAA